MPVETQEIEASATSLVVRSKELTVSDADSYEFAGEFLLAVKTYQKQVADTFDPHISTAHKAHKALVAEKNKHLGPAVKAEGIVKDRMLTWQRAEQRRLDDERKVLEAKARKEAEDRQLKAAAAAEADGRHAKADEILEQNRPPMPVPVRMAAPKLKGISVHKRWTFELVDGEEDLIPREFMTVNTKMLQQYATAMKAKAKVPGVRFYVEDGMSARG